MKKKKSGAKAYKKESLFSKENFKWGIGGIVVLYLISILLINNLCQNKFPIGGFCISNTLFVIINLIGILISGLLYQDIIVSSLKNFLQISILYNLPIYYLIGILIKNIYKKIKK